MNSYALVKSEVEGAQAQRTVGRTRISAGLLQGLIRGFDLTTLITLGAFAAHSTEDPSISWLEIVTVISLALTLVWQLSSRFRIYDVQKLAAPNLETTLMSVFAVVVAPLMAIATIFFVVGHADGSNLSPLARWIALWAAGDAVCVVGCRLALGLVAVQWRKRGLLAQKIAVVGSGELASRLIEHIKRTSNGLVDVIGVFDDRLALAEGRTGLHALRLGTTNDLLTLSQKMNIDKIVVALPHQAEARLLEILRKLKSIPVDITLGPDPMGLKLSEMGGNVIDVAGLPLLNIAPTPLKGSQKFLKDSFDVLAAFGALLLISPLLTLIAIGIKLDSPGPVFFVQKRFGLGNRVIEVFKFRSMYTQLADQGGSKQAVRGDARVTKFGAFLRRTSLDELPQLINVLRGDMSLVGPRPMPVQMKVENRLNHEIVSEYALRHRMKPGITGLAQVSGMRGAVDTEENLRRRVHHDVQYIENWSLWMDFKIMLKTVRVCLSQEDAF